jgi:hypothetical protein
VFSSFQSGDLIICNHISYFDLLYLTTRFSPTFATVLYKDGVPRVVRQTFISAFLHCIFQLTPVSFEKGESLKDIMVYARDNTLGPVVVFPEGTTTNGKGILRFQQVFDENFEVFLKKHDVKMHLVGFQYTTSSVSPAFHLPGFCGHLYTMMVQFSHKMHVTVIDIDDEAQSENFGSFRSYLERYTNCKLISSTIKDKISFLEYWNETQGNYITHKKLD